MPLARAALTALVRVPVVRMVASGVPPIAVTYSIARRPGSSGAPETIAAIVSSRCSLARSSTSAGSVRRGVAAM